ncbi:MAG: tRNA (guanosine(37)-N1)-methyltransferase TrmD [Christensenellaceae bacterium]|jgi:tRNA (guanine37-N1)-methyltransferase|nr:tRNA (guanosine(37)-N1)-methyltransferase TrmD [Christensenellaceae bacterium]
MRIDILTLFVDMFESFKHSIISRAVKKGAIEINLIDIRAFSNDKHKKCDDAPFGGGSGMVMTPQPLYDAIKSVKKRNSHVIYLSPKGSVLNQQKVQQLSKFKHLVLVCGHYEGIDQRVIDLLIDEEISVGDYVLTGGELAAEVLTDAVSRYVDGVIEKGSIEEESFVSGLLEYPHYTRPAEFKKLKVPEVLLSGNHAEIKKWRQEQSEQITKKRRPDLLDSN